MKKLIGGCLVLVSMSAGAAEVPVYYGDLKGTVLTGLVDRASFEFTPGSISNCTKNDVGSLIAYNCQVQGTSAKVTGNGKTISVAFDKVWVAYKRQGDGRWVREYRFRTVYEEKGPVTLSSEANLTLWNYDVAPLDIKGSLSLVDYGVFGGIQATQR